MESCDRTSPGMEHIPPADESIQDPRNFYTADSPVFSNSDSDQELYESAEDFEETLGPLDQGGKQVGGSSLGLRVSFSCLTYLHQQFRSNHNSRGHPRAPKSYSNSPRH